MVQELAYIEYQNSNTMLQLNLNYTVEITSKEKAILFFKKALQEIREWNGCINVQLLQDLLNEDKIDLILYWENIERVQEYLDHNLFKTILSYPWLDNVCFDSNCEIIPAKTENLAKTKQKDNPLDPRLADKIISTLQNQNTDSREKYASSNISQGQIDHYLEIITTYMDEEKPFLDRNLTLVKFSNDLDIHPHHVSRVINERLGCNFSNFVNQYRVKYSKKILLKDLLQKYTISGIGNEAGFNSRSAFYNSFKKYTGMSPGDYVAMTENYQTAV